MTRHTLSGAEARKNNNNNKSVVNVFDLQEIHATSALVSSMVLKSCFPMSYLRGWCCERIIAEEVMFVVAFMCMSFSCPF